MFTKVLKLDWKANLLGTLYDWSCLDLPFWFFFGDLKISDLGSKSLGRLAKTSQTQHPLYMSLGDHCPTWKKPWKKTQQSHSVSSSTLSKYCWCLITFLLLKPLLCHLQALTDKPGTLKFPQVYTTIMICFRQSEQKSTKTYNIYLVKLEYIN